MLVCVFTLRLPDGALLTTDAHTGGHTVEVTSSGVGIHASIGQEYCSDQFFAVLRGLQQCFLEAAAAALWRTTMSARGHFDGSGPQIKFLPTSHFVTHDE